MTISSRTPEGRPNRCEVCGHRCRIEPACLSPDAPCPRCGHLLWFDAGSTDEKVLWWFRNRFGEELNVDPGQITLGTSIADGLGADSLEVVELVMSLEEEFGVHIPDAEAEKIKSVADAMLLIQSLSRK